MTGRFRKLAVPPVSVLAAEFRLTEGEAAVVRALAQGKSPREIALERNVSVHTVRTQLKRIMAKTGEHTQVALVSRVFTRIES